MDQNDRQDLEQVLSAISGIAGAFLGGLGAGINIGRDRTSAGTWTLLAAASVLEVWPCIVLITRLARRASTESLQRIGVLATICGAMAAIAALIVSLAKG